MQKNNIEKIFIRTKTIVCNWFSGFDANDRVLTIHSIDPMILENSKDHHTDRFDLVRREENAKLVVRRGQGFYIKLSMSRCYDFNRDAISLIFTFAGIYTFIN